MTDFENWWYHEGSDPKRFDEDFEEHCKRMCQIAWRNGGEVSARHIEAEWGSRYEAVQREVNYWRQRHDSVMNVAIKNTLLMTPSQPMMLADPESYELGKLHGATAERERAALKVEELGMIGYSTLAIAAAIRKGDQE